MNGRRFGNAFTPSSSPSSSFSSSSSSSSYRDKSSPLLPHYSFFRASACTYARITSGVSLASGRENDVTALSGRPKKRDAVAYSVQSLVLPSCSRAGCYCRLDLRGPRKFLFKKKNKKKRKHRLSFFFSFFGFIGPPEIFNTLTGIYSSSLSHFVARRRHWWTRGLEGNPCRFKEIAVRDRTCDRGISVQSFPENSSGDCILTPNSQRERERERERENLRR